MFNAQSVTTRRDLLQLALAAACAAAIPAVAMADPATVPSRTAATGLATGRRQHGLARSKSQKKWLLSNFRIGIGNLPMKPK